MHDLESLMTTELLSQMQTMFRALCRANDGERNEAADAWYQFLIENHVHPDDLQVVGTAQIERKQVITDLTEQVTRLARENAYLRQQVSANALHEAAAAGEIDPTPWTELYERLVAVWGDPLPANWRSRLARLTDTSVRIVKRWEIGLVEVPAEAIVKIVPEQEVPVPVPEPSGRARQPARRRRVTANQLDILKALDGRELTIRQLSFQLYEEPDTNENLADAVSNLVGRNWLSRQHVAQSTERRTKWAYTLAKEGRQVMEEATEEARDQDTAEQEAAKEKGSG